MLDAARIDAGRRAVRERSRTRALSVAAVCMATVAVLALPWFMGAGGLKGSGSVRLTPATPPVGRSRRTARPAVLSLRHRLSSIQHPQ